MMLNLKARLRCFVDRNSLHPLPAPRRDAVDQLHAIAREEKYRVSCREGEFPPGLNWRWDTFRRLIWLAISLYDSVRQFFIPEKQCRRYWSCFVLDVPRMVYLALRFNLSPVHYYVYDLHRRPLTSDYVRRLFTGWEFHYLSRRMSRLGRDDLGRLDHKVRFAGFCEEAGLPTIPLLDFDATTTCSELEPRDLFAKPACTSGGFDCHWIPFRAASGKWTVAGHSLPAEELPQALRQLFGEQPFLVQYATRNHPDMRWLSQRVLCTVRVVTAWDPSGEPCILRATIRFPGSEEASVDNSSQGGLAAPVDPHTGIITGPAIRWEHDCPVATPIGSQRSFVGFQLPDWAAARNLMLRAHRAAGDLNFPGWDLALTETGPQLLECNVWPDMELVQVPQGDPLLSGDVLDCLKAEKRLWESPAALGVRHEGTPKTPASVKPRIPA